jgi:hypothetical protein
MRRLNARVLQQRTSHLRTSVLASLYGTIYTDSLLSSGTKKHTSAVAHGKEASNPALTEPPDR